METVGQDDIIAYTDEEHASSYTKVQDRVNKKMNLSDAKNIKASVEIENIQHVEKTSKRPRIPWILKPGANFVLWSEKTRIEAKNRTSKALDIFCSFLLFRICYALIAQSELLDRKTVLDITALVMPFVITIQNLLFYHDTMLAKSDVFNYVYLIARGTIFLGLGYTAPSMYTTQLSNNSNFVLFLIVARGTHCLYMIICAFFDDEVGPTFFVSGLLSLLPTFVWIFSIIQNEPLQIYLYFMVGCILDCLAVIFIEFINMYSESRREKRFLSRASQDAVKEAILMNIKYIDHAKRRLIDFTGFVIACGMLLIYPVDNDIGFPESIVSLKFEKFQFILCSFGGLYLFSMFLIYEGGIRNHQKVIGDSKLQRFKLAKNYSLLGTGLNSILLVTLIFCLGALRLVLDDLFQQSFPSAKLIYQVPLNMSYSVGMLNMMQIPETSANSLGYLIQAGNFVKNNAGIDGYGTSKMSGPLWRPINIFIASSGLFLVLQSLLEVFWNAENWNLSPRVLHLEKSIYWKIIAGFTMAMCSLISISRGIALLAVFIAVIVIFFVFAMFKICDKLRNETID